MLNNYCLQFGPATPRLCAANLIASQRPRSLADNGLTTLPLAAAQPGRVLAQVRPTLKLDRRGQTIDRKQAGSQGMVWANAKGNA